MFSSSCARKTCDEVSVKRAAFTGADQTCRKAARCCLSGRKHNNRQVAAARRRSRSGRVVFRRLTASQVPSRRRRGRDVGRDEQRGVEGHRALSSDLSMTGCPRGTICLRTHTHTSTVSSELLVILSARRCAPLSVNTDNV